MSVRPAQSVGLIASCRARPAARLVMNRHDQAVPEQTSRISRIASAWMALRSNDPPISGTTPTTAIERVEDDRDDPVDGVVDLRRAGCAAARAAWSPAPIDAITTKLIRQIVVVPVPPTWANRPISAGSRKAR